MVVNGVRAVVAGPNGTRVLDVSEVVTGLDKQRLATMNLLWNSKSTKCPAEAAMPTCA